MKNAYDYFLEYTNKDLFYAEKSVEWNLMTEEIKKLLALQVVKKRQSEYPPLEDFADAWIKNDESALEEYRQKCLSVKIKYPKPL